jgi:hypothetical protein
MKVLASGGIDGLGGHGERDWWERFPQGTRRGLRRIRICIHMKTGMWELIILNVKTSDYGTYYFTVIVVVVFVHQNSEAENLR